MSGPLVLCGHKSTNCTGVGLAAVQSLLRWTSRLSCSGKKRQWELVQSNDQRQDPVQLKVSLQPRHGQLQCQWLPACPVHAICWEPGWWFQVPVV